MTPETEASGRLEIWRCADFPNEWELYKVVAELKGTSDPQYFYHKGKHYLFVTVGDENKLTIFMTDHLKADWNIHSRHELLNSRSAGNIFEYKGKLLRPVQDCSKIYGGAIIFKEITLNPFHYEEKEYERIEPEWADYLIGTHTFNFTKDYVVIDGKYETEVHTP